VNGLSDQAGSGEYSSQSPLTTGVSLLTAMVLRLLSLPGAAGQLSTSPIRTVLLKEAPMRTRTGFCADSFQKVVVSGTTGTGTSGMPRTG